jgi:4-hydroxy-3-methylbut-2-en-1-yl diphosphate synthase IspG/GcpE
MRTPLIAETHLTPKATAQLIASMALKKVKPTIINSKTKQRLRSVLEAAEKVKWTFSAASLSLVFY